MSDAESAAQRSPRALTELKVSGHLMSPESDVTCGVLLQVDVEFLEDSLGDVHVFGDVNVCQFSFW